ncbi:hypothetical protein SELMODRAFT_402093 [Selaginella moellendorffii]|uniref:Uncharacterized protein n=1 Tax=Selaginella moellendorffii TaxID=88036 RepID=D8QPK1_SELML|nr:hypothetical protein SELMODRAFT_402093 [Selaginella moellendorffii]
MVGARACFGGRDSYAAGRFLALPDVVSLHKRMDALYVREVFNALYQDIVETLAIEDCSLCLLNGNSGVGKSAFLWYFIIRTGIDKPGSLILYESETFIWEFRGRSLKHIAKQDYPLHLIESPSVDYHLIDQKISSGRTLGARALLAGSPDESNTKIARKLRMTYTRYLPVWNKREFDALVESWKRRADSMPRLPDGSPSARAAHAYQRVAAANLAFEWFGGVPRLLWDHEVETLTEEDFASDVTKCLSSTKLKNVAAILENHGSSQNVSWRLFHFVLRPGSFSRFQYTFCSDKVASMFAQYLCSATNVGKLGRFLEATRMFKEYASLRGFVFEQAIQLAVERATGRIQCGACLGWYHTKCVQAKVTSTRFRCERCDGAPEVVEPLLLRYYEGDLEDALLGAGMDAAKFLWRPLGKNSTGLGFVWLPRTLGVATVCRDRKPAVEHLAKAMQALRSWRHEYDRSYTEEDTIVLLFLVSPDAFSSFQFQPYQVSGKVSHKAMQGVVQCKMAVPVQGSAYLSLLEPRNLEGVAAVDLDRPETWEDVLGCVELAQDHDNGLEMLLTEEKIGMCERKLVYEGDFLDVLEELEDIQDNQRRLQAVCKIYKIPATSSSSQMLADLRAKRQELGKLKAKCQELEELEELD